MLRTTYKEFTNFLPDRMEYDPNTSVYIRNVIPTADGYRPFSKLDASLGQVGSGGITGAFSAIKDDGTYAIFAATAAKIYLYDSGTDTWDDVTNTGADYTGTATDYWSFAQFGPYVVACNGVDNNQYYEIGTSTDFSDLTNSPKAKYVAAVGSFLVLGNLIGDSSRALAWSAIEDIESWSYGQQLSDRQQMPDGGEITGIVAYENGAIVFQYAKVRSMTRVLDDNVFSFAVVHKELGSNAPYSIISVDNQFYWYNESGFHMGREGQEIATEQLDRYVRKLTTPTLLRQMHSIYDPFNKMIYWVIEKSNGEKVMLGYHTKLGKWTQIDTSADWVFLAVPPGITIDGLANISSTIDGLTIPVDDPYYEGDATRILAGFDSDGNFGFFSGGNLPAVLRTNEIAVFPGYNAQVNEVKFVTDAAVTDYDARLATRRFPGGTKTWHEYRMPDTTTSRVYFGNWGGTHQLELRIKEDKVWDHINGFYVTASRRGNL